MSKEKESKNGRKEDRQETDKKLVHTDVTITIIIITTTNIIPCCCASTNARF